MSRLLARIEKIESRSNLPRFMHQSGLAERIRKARLRCGIPVDRRAPPADVKATMRMCLGEALDYYRRKRLETAHATEI